MKYFFLLIPILSMSACKKYNNVCNLKINEEALYHKRLTYKVIDLQDPLGIIYIEFPRQMDGYLEWYNASDCTCCGYQSYRLAAPIFKPVMESGWIKEPIPDSVYQITFFHSPNTCTIDFPLEAKDSIDQLLWNWGPQSIKDAKFPIIFIETKMIHDIKWITYAYILPSAFLNNSTINPYIYVVEAKTVIDNKILHFKAECQAADCENFIEAMKKAIASIRYCNENHPD